MLTVDGRARQLVILSGKGGTGKTSLNATFAHLSSLAKPAHPPVFVDADVDAANLSLVMQPIPMTTNEFWGGWLAEINGTECTGCGKCVTVCRYEAIHPDDSDPIYTIDPIACDGCAACVYACPQRAITMAPQQEGYWFHSSTPYGALFHAELFAGRDNSGKLVTLVKQQARLWAEETGAPLVVIDGPPGIGCPVISACAGADLGLIVTEPGLAGLHDLQRALGTLQHFHIPAVICINKADLYPEGTQQIRRYASDQGVAILGEIPFDERIPQAMLLGQAVTSAFPDSPAALAIAQIWNAVNQQLFDRKEA